MKIDKIRILFFELLLVVILFFALFASNNFTRNILSIILLIYALLICISLKKREITSIYKKQATIFLIVFALVYLVILYAMGLYFGFMIPKITFSTNTIFKFILPISVLIISSEIIRKIFLSHQLFINIKANKINISTIITYFSMVILDILIYTGIYDLSNLDDFLVALGFVLFASLSSNLFFNYATIRYGSKGIIIYRLITILYIYILPVVPDLYIFFQSFLRLLYPFLMYVFLEKLYSQNDFAVAYGDKKKEFIGTTILLIITTLFIMLISCQFRFGILVVGSHSMTGTLNKGDAIIFEKYDKQNIEVGQIILFEYNNMQVMHRVIEINEVNGQRRYYTQGDANKKPDEVYSTDENIIGLVNLRIKYLGYPTLWVKDIFEKN